MTLFLIILAVLGFLILTGLTIFASVKVVVNDTLFLYQYPTGFVSATAAAFLKLQLYNQHFSLSIFLIFLLDWVMLLAAYFVWGWFVYFQAHNLVEWFDRKKPSISR
ncbi:MAG TPA: hypothetical protein VLE93_02155 [Candidatus Saccharimonadales bacterium]|nr:hypothetical protein [Candidatus Saccharimonadales bacterium]